MKLGIMQPYFFPYIGYFALINAVDKFVVYDDVSYIKNGWINRNRIKINNCPKYITAPVTNASMNYLINETKIVKYDNFKAKFLKTIEINYKCASQYNTVFCILDEILSFKYESIGQLNLVAIDKVMKYLNVETEISLSSSIEKNNLLKSQEKIIDICRNLNATEYINLVGGVNLYSKERFKQEGINLSFIKMKEIVYSQGKGDYIPNLSIVDVMMWNHVDGIRKMLEEYDLV